VNRTAMRKTLGASLEPMERKVQNSHRKSTGHISERLPSKASLLLVELVATSAPTSNKATKHQSHGGGSVPGMTEIALQSPAAIKCFLASAEGSVGLRSKQ
jgi:hypothetical protein